MIELHEPDNGERFTRSQVKALMMFALGGALPEQPARFLVSETFKVYDQENSPLQCLIANVKEG